MKRTIIVGLMLYVFSILNYAQQPEEVKSIALLFDEDTSNYQSTVDLEDIRSISELASRTSLKYDSSLLQFIVSTN